MNKKTKYTLQKTLNFKIMGRTKYRIIHRYPVYPGGTCIPYDGYFVQKLKEGFIFDKWIDIKGFTSIKEAEKLKKILEN